MLKNILALTAGFAVALVFFGCAAPVKNTLPVQTFAANMRPVLPIGKVSVPPVIDGKLDDPCWKTAAMASGFVNTAGEWSRLQVICFLAYDDQCLYMAFDSAEEDVERLSQTPLPHDAVSIFGNDTVEVFLQPDMANGKYYHFAVSPAGSYYEARCKVERGSETERDEEWNPSWDRKVSKISGHWITELAIPFSALIPPGDVSGTQWGLNLCRTRQGLEASASSWAMARKGFNQPTEFGRMLFAPMPGVSYGIRSWGYPVFGEPLRLVVRNGTDRPCEVQPTWCFGYGGTSVFSKEAVRLAPGEEREVSYRINLINKDVTNDIPMSQFVFETRFDLIDPGVGTSLDQRAARLVLPSPFTMTLDRYYLDTDIHEIRVSLGRRILRGNRWILEIAPEPNAAPLLSQTILAGTKAESTEYSFNIQTLPCGRYIVSATLLEDNQPVCTIHRIFFKCPARFPSSADGLRKVSIGKHGTLLVNGEPFCPFMASPGPKNLAPPFPLKACFNVRYSSLGLISNPMERVSLDLGAFGREDGKTIIVWPENSNIQEKVKTMVLARRSDPSLLYWFIRYEASIPLYRREGTSMIPLNNPEEYKKVQRLLKELDPGHLSSIHVDKPEVIDAYKNVADIIETACWTSSYARNLIPNIAADVARIRAQVGEDKPLIYWIGSSIPSAALRTAEETRCAVYLVLMHGANGIVFHMGHAGISPEYTRLWSVYEGLAGEVEQLYPILVSGDRLFNLDVTPPDSIDWCVRQCRGKIYIVAVNSTGRLVMARFAMGAPAVADGGVRVMFEERRIALNGNVFSDSFTAYEPHVYELLPVTPGGGKKTGFKNKSNK